jgi:hypothetical protein
MWGTETQGTHPREGETGYDVLLGGTVGETLSSPTISTKPQWIVQGSKGMSEEPDVLIGHVRICGGLAGNRWVYPEPDRANSALRVTLVLCVSDVR